MQLGMNPALFELERAMRSAAIGEKSRRIVGPRFTGTKPRVNYAAANSLARRGINATRLKRKISRFRATGQWAQEFNLLTPRECHRIPID